MMYARFNADDIRTYTTLLIIQSDHPSQTILLSMDGQFSMDYAVCSMQNKMYLNIVYLNICDLKNLTSIPN